MNPRDVAKVVEGFEKGVFVRDTSRDHESDWAIRVFPYLAALARLAEDLEKNGGKVCT